MGGSFIGELWFNFGYFSIFIALFFGILLGKFSIAIFKKNKKNYSFFMPYFLYIATLVVWWVRQYFTTVAWSALFYGIVIFILHSIVKNKKIGACK